MVYDTHEQTPRIFTGTFGGLSLGSPKMVAQLCDIVITCLPSATEMRDVFFGWEGLATGFKGEGLVMDIGTTDPLETVEMAGSWRGTMFTWWMRPLSARPTTQGKAASPWSWAAKTARWNAAGRCWMPWQRKVIRAGATGSAQAAVAIADYVRAARLLAASEAIRLGEQFRLRARQSSGCL